MSNGQISQLIFVIQTTVMLMAVLTASVSRADWGTSSARIDQHVVIRIESTTITVDYTMTMNRASAFQEVLAIDANGDGRMSPAEQDAHFGSISRQIAAGIELTVDGREQSLRQVGQMQLSMPFTKRMQFQVDPPDGSNPARLEFHNDNYLAARGNASIEVQVAAPLELTFNSLENRGIKPSAKDLVFKQQRDAIIRYRNVDEPALVSSASRQTTKGSAAFYGLVFAVTLAPLALAAVSWFTLRHRLTTCWFAVLGILLLAVLPHWLPSSFATDSPHDRALSNDEAEWVFRNLHGNTYQALSAKNEEQLYERLASSLEGDLLRETYLEMHRLTLPHNRSTSFQLRRIKALESKVLRDQSKMSDRFSIRHRWRVYGTIAHAGHRHGRINEYEATFSVIKTSDGWRISRRNVRNCHRADGGMVFAAVTKR